MKERINRLADIDLKTATAEDLRWQYGTHSSESKGKGRDKVTTNRSGVQTPIGDIQIDVWVEAVKAVIHRDGLDEELEHMTGYYLKDKTPAIFQKNLEIRALDAVLSGLYKDPAWFGFIEYNEKYHTELLSGADLVVVYTDCCGAPCTFTQTWLDLGKGYATCPKCGEWTTIHRHKENATEGKEDL